MALLAATKGTNIITSRPFQAAINAKPLPRALVTVALLLALSNGLSALVISGPVRDFSMIVITVLVAIWWLANLIGPSQGLPVEPLVQKLLRRGSWVDSLVAAWVAAIVIAWVANDLSNRRSATGAWYDGLALLVIIVLVDLIGRGIARRWLVDGLLLTGGGWLLVGSQQFVSWVIDWLQTRGTGLPFLPVRPIGVFGNPNSFATALLALIFLSVSRIPGAQRVAARIGWTIYSSIALLLMFLTQSRGGWVGAAGGVAVGLVLLFRYSRIQLSWRRITAVLGAMLVVGLVVTIFVVLPLFRATGRSDNRPDIYRIAIQSFAHQPLTGHGPDSFSLQLLENQSIPPEPAHLHAHQTILHIAAELGIPGLLAMVLSIVVGVRLYWRNLTQSPVDDRPLLIGLGTACVAIAVHGLFDVTATQPSLFMLDAGLFALAVAPRERVPAVHVDAPIDRNRHAVAVAAFGLRLALSLFVVIAGWIGTLAYDPYWAGVQSIAAQPFPGGWVGARPLFELAADRDPLSPMAAAAAGYTDGLLAIINADSILRAVAIRYYERAITLEAPNAFNWLNLARLYDMGGQADKATYAAEQSIRYASNAPLFLINSGLILEQNGQINEATAAYTMALKLAPALANQPVWQATDVRRAIVAQWPTLSTDRQRFLTLLNGGQVENARQQVAVEQAADWAAAQPYLDHALLLIRAHDDLMRAARDMKAAEMNFDIFQDWPWFHYVQSELDAARGDQAGHDRELALVLHDPSHDQNGVSILGGNAAAGAYFMADLPRQLLPGAWYPAPSTDLMALLSASNHVP